MLPWYLDNLRTVVFGFLMLSNGDCCQYSIVGVIGARSCPRAKLFDNGVLCPRLIMPYAIELQLVLRDKIAQCQARLGRWHAQPFQTDRDAPTVPTAGAASAAARSSCRGMPFFVCSFKASP